MRNTHYGYSNKIGIRASTKTDRKMISHSMERKARNITKNNRMTHQLYIWEIRIYPLYIFFARTNILPYEK